MPNARGRQGSARWGLVLLAVVLFWGAALSLAALLLRGRQERASQETEQRAREMLAAVPQETSAIQAAAVLPDPQADASIVLPPVQVQEDLEDGPGILAKFQTLKQEMPDTAGWLKIRALYQVDLPVMQRDNEFYLTHDASGEVNENGAAFLDEYNHILPRDDNLIVYAHNRASGRMFGSLFRLGYREYVSSSPITEFSTLYEEGLYIPFAVFQTTVGTEHDFDFLVTAFSDTGEKKAFIEEARARSYLEADVDCGTEDMLLTLVTCVGEGQGERLVVMMRRLRPDETEDSVRQYFR